MEIDWEIIDLREEFGILEASFLWFELLPAVSLKEADLKVRTLHKTLYKMWMQENIDGYEKDIQIDWALKRGENVKVTGEFIQISRKSLIAYANRIGQKPSFLFPESRSKKNQKPKKLDARQKKSYLMVIKFLMRKANIYSDKHGIGTEMEKELSLLGFDRDSEALLSVLKEAESFSPEDL